MDKRWLILAALFTARIAMGFQFQSVAATAPLLAAGLGVDYARIGVLIGLYMLPGIVIALPGGVIGQRFADKSVCMAGLALMLAGGVALGLSTGFAPAFAARLASGTGAVLFNLVLTKMVTDWFAGREIVFAMAVILASWPCGIAIALLVQPPLAASWGWPAVMDLTAALCGAALLLVAAFYAPPSGGRRGPDAPVPALSLPPARETLPVVVAGTMWGLFNLGLILYFSFAAPLLGEHGMKPAQAASVASVALWLSMASLPLGGWLVQRSGLGRTAIVASGFLAALAMALLPAPVWPLLPCVAVGLAIGPPAGAIMALPARVLAPGNRAAGFGVFYTCFYLTTALGPVLAGAMRDGWGSAAAPVVLGALAFAAPALLLPGFEVLAARRMRARPA